MDGLEVASQSTRGTSRSESDSEAEVAAESTTGTERSKPDLTGFLACSNLRTLHLEGLHPVEWMSDYISLMEQPVAEPGSGHVADELGHSQTFAVFPNLEKLILSDLDLTRKSEVHGNDAKERIPPVMTSIASALKARAQKLDGKHRLGQLEIIGGVSKRWVKKIEEEQWIQAQEGVTWDRKAHCVWDYDDEEENDFNIGEEGRV